MQNQHKVRHHIGVRLLLLSRRGRWPFAAAGLVAVIVALVRVYAWFDGGRASSSLETRTVRQGRVADLTPQSDSGLLTETPTSRLPASAPSPDMTPDIGLLFTIPSGDTGIHFTGQPECCHSGLFGFGVALDGSFWVGDQTQNSQVRNPRLLHYSPRGALLGTVQVPQIANLYDVKVSGGNILALDGEQAWNKTILYSAKGRALAIYKMGGSMDKGGPPGLIIGEHNEVLLGGLWNRTYAQLANASGTLDIKLSDGYPHGGKLYKAWPAGPPIQNPTTGYIQAGDVQITLTSRNTVENLEVLRVFPDGSFYVLAQSSYLSDGTILHYKADGTLVDAAPLPIRGQLAEVLHQLDTSPDGTVYVLTTALEVRRLSFGPAYGFTSKLGFPPAATATATPAEALPVFSIPNKDDHGYGPDSSFSYDDLRGLGVAADGSFWIGNYRGQQVTLMHTSAVGAALETKRSNLLDDQPELEPWARIYSVQVRENDPWILVGRPAAASITRLDGTDPFLCTLAHYPLPQRIGGADVGELLVKQELAFTFGPSGEVLLSWDSPDTRVALLVDAAGKPVPFGTDANGKTSIKSQAYYPGVGRTYKSRLSSAPGTSPLGSITSGSTTITVTVNSPLVGLHIFHVAPDSSFYVLTDQEGGSPQVRYGTVLHYSGSSQLLGVVRIPGMGSYSAMMRRLAVGSNGNLYTLVPQADSVAIQQPIFFPALHPLSIPVKPTPTATPTPGPYAYVTTPTSTPSSIDVLTQRSTLVVEAEVVSGDSDRKRTFQGIRVLRWLKPGSGNTDYVNLEETQDENDRISLGSGRYIFFLEPNQLAYSYWCQSADFYEISGGLDGIYEIRGDRIGWAGLPSYSGWSVARFETALQRLPGASTGNNNTQTPTPPDTSAADLAHFANSADVVAEIDNLEGSGATGTVLYSGRVRKWLKRPPGITDNRFGFAAGKCEAGRVGLGSGHYIVFLMQGANQSDSWNGWDYLAGGPGGVYSISDGIVEMGGIAHFQGWTVERFEAAIRAALAVPVAPDPNLQRRYSDPNGGK